MLNEQTLTQLKSLRLHGMVATLADHASSSAASELRFEERLALLVQREIDWRDDKGLARLLEAARLKVSGACIEDINWRASRGLDRHLITALAGCDWVRHARKILITEMEALPPEAPRILLATGKLVGEGFDHPPLYTLVLAMPVSWKGTLQQYAGRLHREHASKADVRIIDCVDTGHPALLRMWEKRQRGYRAMGYRVGVDASDGQASMEDVEAPGLVPSEQLFARQEVAAGVADVLGL